MLIIYIFFYKRLDTPWPLYLIDQQLICNFLVFSTYLYWQLTFVH